MLMSCSKGCQSALGSGTAKKEQKRRGTYSILIYLRAANGGALAAWTEASETDGLQDGYGRSDIRALSALTYFKPDVW